MKDVEQKRKTSQERANRAQVNEQNGDYVNSG